MKYILGCLLLVISVSTNAANSVAENFFNQGIDYFKQGEYKKALNSFNRAYQNKLDSAALHYNLGATYFKLENYTMAEKHFLRTSKFNKMAPVAYYNLGLVKLQQRDNLQARAWFQKAYDTTKNKKIKNLAATQLKKAHDITQKWRNFVFANIGYNDNVTLDNDAITIASNQADSFLELFAFSRGLISGSTSDGVLIKARLYSDLYASLSDYNLTEINAGIYKTYPLAGWNTESGLYLKYSTQGGRGYLQSANLSFSGKKYLSDKTRLRLRLRLREIQAIDPIYDSLSGSAQDLRIESRWKLNQKNRLRAYYQFDNNDRENYTSTTSFISRSPIRHRFRFDYYFPFTAKWNGQLSAEYRQSQYKDNNTNTTTGLDQQRIDDRLRGKIAVTRRMTKQLMLNIEYAYTQNSSTINTYEYTQNVLLGGIQYSF